MNTKDKKILAERLALYHLNTEIKKILAERLALRRLNIESIREILTWHNISDLVSEFGSLEDHSIWPLGTLLEDKNGKIFLVGDADLYGYTLGCGCCADRINPVRYAFISDLFYNERQ
jgi:hypothetical protein